MNKTPFDEPLQILRNSLSRHVRADAVAWGEHAEEIEQIKSAIALLEAAGKSDRRQMLDFINSSIGKKCFECDEWNKDGLDCTYPGDECKYCITQRNLRALVEAIPDRKE